MGSLGGSVGKESACNAEDKGAAGSIPGWGRIPWTEEPDRPQSIGSQKVRHD